MDDVEVVRTGDKDRIVGVGWLWRKAGRRHILDRRPNHRFRRIDKYTTTGAKEGSLKKGEEKKGPDRAGRDANHFPTVFGV
jgi:ribosomal protein L35